MELLAYNGCDSIVLAREVACLGGVVGNVIVILRQGVHDFRIFGWNKHEYQSQTRMDLFDSVRTTAWQTLKLRKFTSRRNERWKTYPKTLWGTKDICSVGCRKVLLVCMRFRPIARQLLDAWCQHAQLTYEKNSDGVVKNTKSTLTTPCTMRSTLYARSSQFNFLYAFRSLSSLIPREDPWQAR